VIDLLHHALTVTAPLLDRAASTLFEVLAQVDADTRIVPAYAHLLLLTARESDIPGRLYISVQTTYKHSLV
jgi:hypothetical protein